MCVCSQVQRCSIWEDGKVNEVGQVADVTVSKVVQTSPSAKVHGVDIKDTHIVYSVK